MPILLDSTNKYLKVKVLSGPKWGAEKTIIAKTPGRIPIYERGDTFDHWQIPIENLSHIINNIGKDNIISTENSQPLLDRYFKKTIKIDDLPRETVTRTVYGDRTLEPHQIEVVSINKEKTTLLLAAQTGLGKTFSAIARADFLSYKKVLIIGPKKLRSNWRTEVRETLDESCLIFWGDKKTREKLKDEIPKHNIIFTTYEQLEEFTKYNTTKFDQIIVDEIHLVCNDKTKTFKSLNRVLRAHDGGLMGLSATPSRMRMSDLWGVLYLMDPDFAGSKSNFLGRYEEVLATMTIRKNGRPFKIPIKVRAKNQEELQERLKSLMVRIRKDTVLDFKDNVDIIRVDLTNRQRSIYEEALSQIKLELSDRTLKLDNPLTKLLRLLQISEGLFNISDKYNDSGKLEYLADDLKDIGDQKAVIWSRFLPIVEKIYELNPTKTVRYSGNQNDAEKQLAVWAFQGVKTPEDEAEFYKIRERYPYFKFKPGEAQFFTGTHSLKSGIGINLQAANLVYFTSFDYNPTAVHQARDRVSRIGQEKDTFTKFIVTNDTIEERVLQTILRHYRNSIELLDGKSSENFRLTNELMGILRGDI
jgi:SNF2 family DNA or RNA helicase